MTIPTQTGVIAANPGDSQGPAAEVPDATNGGTITIIRESKISHLDPPRVYSFAGLMNAPCTADSSPRGRTMAKAT
jgi:peptide/nickel transport system substrate-binding protein